MFTLGNVITLALCVALVLVFRQIDANNKSIDKVKKFTDKLKEDLDRYFKGRNDALKEAAVDLDVKQTHAIASVKRLEEFESNFTTRAAEMEERIASLTDVEKRIDNYDTIIKNLIEMTSRAEDNLQQLSAQSKHFDGAFRKIKELQDRLAQLDSSIPAITEDFAKKNEEQLQNIGAHLLDEFDARTTALNQQYERHVQKCTELYNSIDLHIRESFESATRKAELLEDTTFDKLEEKTRNRLDDYLAAVDEKNSVIRKSVEMQISSIQELTQTFKTQIGEELSAYEDSIRGDMQNITAKYQDTVLQLDTRVSDFEKTTARRIDEFNGVMDANDQRIELTFRDTEAKINTFKEDIKQNIKEAAAALEDMNGEFAAKTKELHANFSDVESQLQSTADSKIKEIETALHTQISGLEKQMASSYSGISDELESKNTALLSEIATRFEAYKTDVMYRFKSIDKFSADVTQVEEQLRKSMDDVKSSVDADFNSFVHDQQTKQATFEKTIQDNTVALSKGLQNLEQDLNELREKATGNITSRMKLFEDDFFTGLEKRGEAVDAALSNWTADMDEKLLALANEAEDGRRKIEFRHTEDLKAHLAELEEKYKDLTTAYDERYKSIDGSIQNKLVSYEETVKEFIDQSRSALTEAKASADEHVRTELATHAAAIEEQINNQKRDITDHIKGVLADVDSTREKTEASLESIKSDFATWRDRLTQQFTESKETFDERFASLEAKSADLITQVGETFKTDVENYGARVGEEKDRLISELNDLRTQMEQSVSGYEARAGEMIEDFKKSYETMLEETGQKIREQNNDSDQKLRALKTLVQEIRDKTEVTQEKMMLKMQSDANTINLSMDDIDKRLKNFVAQTQLFEKADELKANLEIQIGSLKTEISKVESFRQTATDLDQQFIKIRRMEDDVNQKLTKFASEKKRIELLEENFDSLMKLSASMEQKISDLKNSHDELQSLQLELRHYQDGVTEISGRYDRLEKKSPVLEQTMVGVDRSFENLQQIEKRIAACNLEAQKLPEQVSDIKKTVEKLLDGNTRVNEAVEKLASLDVVLKDTENRMVEMSKAREWLARTETRMGELARQAQDQVKIMGDLLKEEPSARSGGKRDVSKDDGAPSFEKRETVVKLKKQGWTIDEIAKRMHISQGEVELIMELNNGVK